MSLSFVLMLIFPALAIVAAFKDATSFTIPNWISASAALAFAPVALLAGAEPGALGLHLAVGVGALVCGMAMFALGWIGGGDAKLLAASALWLGWSALLPFLMFTALAGGVLAVGLLNLRADWLRRLAPAGPVWIERLREKGAPAPYGVALAVGALAAFPQSDLLRLAVSG